MRVFKALIVAIVVMLSCSVSAHAVRRRSVVIVDPFPRTPAKRVVVTRPPVAARRIVVGGVAYWVHRGVYYKLVNDGYVIVKAPVIRILPRYHRIVVIHGVVYYVADGVYYRKATGGYIVVEKPVEVTEVVSPAPETVVVASDTFTLHVPKRTGGGFVSVTLKKVDEGYLGPQG